MSSSSKMLPEPVISVTNLSKSHHIYPSPQARLWQFLTHFGARFLSKEAPQFYIEFCALKDVSFNVRSGETLGIIGSNGAGKSTLLQMICGTLYPTEGQVEVSGRVAALLELGSGFNPEFTGRENVYLNAQVLGQSLEVTREKFESIVSFADIGDFIDQPTKTYSSGMLMRLAFAVIAHVDADILVIDEALAVGDAFFTQKCMRFLRNFMKSGTVLFVSHDTAAVKSLCDRVIWLERGKLIADGDPKEVCELYLKAFYESQQGAYSAQNVPPPSETEGVRLEPQKRVAEYLDQRDALINGSNLRNDIEVYRYDHEAPSFGIGGCSVLSVVLEDSNQTPLSWVIGGEDVALKVSVSVEIALNAPIVGFIVKDRLGQALFGDNTYLNTKDCPVIAEPGAVLTARFRFHMPRLPKGEYSITIAIANGTQEEHVQHQWIYDALTLKSEASSVSSGLIGIPMQEISLNVDAVKAGLKSFNPRAGVEVVYSG